MVIEYGVDVPPLQVGPPAVLGMTLLFYFVEFHDRLAGTHHMYYRTSLTLTFASAISYAWFGSLVNRPNKMIAPPEGGA